jgi:hypothetical protein
MPVALKGSTSGQVTLDVPSAAGTNTLTLPAKTGNIITSADSGTVTGTMLASNIAGNGPACMAYTASGTQSISATTFTKITLSSELFGLSNSGYNTSTQRFVPQTAGYYYFNGSIYLSGSAVTYQTYIYKNGAYALSGPYFTAIGTSVSGLIYANGTTDYFEMYIYSASTMNVAQGVANTYMQASLIRSA